MCGKPLTFLYTSPYEHVQYSLTGFGWNTLFAQRRRQWSSITSALGQCIVLSGVSGAGIESVTSIVDPMQQSENPVQSTNAVSLSGQYRRLWVNIETALGEWYVFARSIQQTQ